MAALLARQRDAQRAHTKYLVQGKAVDGRTIHIVCRMMRSGGVLVITVFEGRP